MSTPNRQLFRVFVATVLTLVVVPAVADPVKAPANSNIDRGAEVPSKTRIDIGSSAPGSSGKANLAITDENGLFRLQFQARLQALYAYESEEGTEQFADEQAFSINRARLTLKGHVFSRQLKYKFQSDFGKGALTLKDFYVNYESEDVGLQLRVGQWKRPFSRQQITSSGRLELISRATTDKAFGAGRDIGFAIHNGYEKSPPLEFALGVFNGTGIKPALRADVMMEEDEAVVVNGKFTNVPQVFHPAVVLRAGLNHGRVKGYQEADLDGGDLRAGIAFSTLVEFDADGDDNSGVRSEIDGIAKFHHLSLSGGFFHGLAQDGTSFYDQDYDAIGAHIQLGYAVAGWVQPVVRYSRVDPTGDENHEDVYTLGLSTYFFAHNVKWQNEASLIDTSVTEEGSVTTYQVLSQMQFAF